MRGCSAYTNALDPYRAGLDLGAKLSPIAPEIVFLFNSIHLGLTADILDGLYDGIGDDDLKVIGCSGDGVYETFSMAHHGACALGLNSDGNVKWHIIAQAGIQEDPTGATQAAFTQVQEQLKDKPASLMMVYLDFRTDSSLVEKVLKQQTGAPIVGGIAGDDCKGEACVVYANRQALQNNIIVLAAEGSIRYNIYVDYEFPPVGNPGTIEAVNGSIVSVIDGISAKDFVEREIGKPMLGSDLGTIGLMVADPDDPDVKRLRTFDYRLIEQDSIAFHGGIKSGETVRVCLPQPEDLIRGINNLCNPLESQIPDPAAALVVSCVGRKRLLGEDALQEAQALQRQLGSTLPLAGFPSFGEIAPLRTQTGYTHTMLHNMAFVLIVFGQ
jgi:hypothetical protein